MLTPVYTKQFARDTKQMKKRRKNLEKLKIIIRSIVMEEELDPIHRDHKLIGNWKGRRECHIESDWLLIYMIESGKEEGFGFYEPEIIPPSPKILIQVPNNLPQALTPLAAGQFSDLVFETFHAFGMNPDL